MTSFIPVTDHKIAILDQSGTFTPYIREQLVKYKSRWNESVAHQLTIHTSEYDIPEGVTIIAPDYNQPTTLHNPTLLVPSINLMTHYDLRAAVIDVHVSYTKDPVEAKQFLDSLKPVFAFDTEAASKYSDEELEELKIKLAETIDFYNPEPNETPEQASARELAMLDDTQPIRSKLASNALVMSKNQTTMYSFADAEDRAFVVDSNPETDEVVLNFLTETTSLVIMHNALYDMRLVYNRTKKFIKNFEDTQLMQSVIKNNTNTLKAKVGLKLVAQPVYREWAVANDKNMSSSIYTNEVVQYNNFTNEAICPK